MRRTATRAASGAHNVCVNFSLIGIHEDGGLQEKLRIAAGPGLPDRRARARGGGDGGAGLDRGARRPPGAGSRRASASSSSAPGRSASRSASSPSERGASVLVVDPQESRLETESGMGAETLRLERPPTRSSRHAREWSGGDGPAGGRRRHRACRTACARWSTWLLGRAGGAGRHVGRRGDAAGRQLHREGARHARRQLLRPRRVRRRRSRWSSATVTGSD